MFSDLSVSNIFIVIICMLISIPTHEAMHAFAAHALGDRTAQEQGRLTLNPFKHVDLMMTIVLPAALLLVHLPPIFVAKPVPFDSRNVRYGDLGAAIVAVAGPFTNLLLAFIGSMILRLVPQDIGPTLDTALLLFVQINVMLFVFNMIPLPPLDGSRLLYAFAPEAVQRVMYQMESMGLGFTIMVLLLLSSFISPIILNITNTITTFLLR